MVSPCGKNYLLLFYHSRAANTIRADFFLIGLTALNHRHIISSIAETVEQEE
jgi:hypothetical protein